MTWEVKQIILKALGHSNFSCEEEYDEWYSELDNIPKRRIDKALYEAEEYGLRLSNAHYSSSNKSENGKRITNAAASVNC